MAILIEFGILNKLFKWRFFAVSNALLQIPENNLSDDQLGVLIVVRSHISSFASYVPDTIIISNSQSFKIRKDVGSLSL